MIGEDGLHDRRGRASGSRACRVEEARARGGGRAARGGPRVGHRSPTRTTCRTRTARAMRIEPLISLQWFCDMEKLAGPAIAAAKDGPAALPPRAPADAASTSTGWRTSGPGASRASCGGATRSRSGTAARRPTSGSEAAGGRRAGSATPTCSTRGSPRPCGRSPRSAGPSRPTSCAPSTPPTCSPRRATSSSSGWPGWSCSASSSPASCRSPTCRSTP